jgi:hypothetical protein
MDHSPGLDMLMFQVDLQPGAPPGNILNGKRQEAEIGTGIDVFLDLPDPIRVDGLHIVSTPFNPNKAEPVLWQISAVKDTR